MSSSRAGGVKVRVIVQGALVAAAATHSLSCERMHLRSAVKQIFWIADRPTFSAEPAELTYVPSTSFAAVRCAPCPLLSPDT